MKTSWTAGWVKIGWGAVREAGRELLDQTKVGVSVGSESEMNDEGDAEQGPEYEAQGPLCRLPPPCSLEKPPDLTVKMLHTGSSRFPSQVTAPSLRFLPPLSAQSPNSCTAPWNGHSPNR